MLKFKRIYKLLPVMLTLVLGLALIPQATPALAASSQTASAQAVPVQSVTDSQLQMKNLDIQVWPEYDDKRVLTVFNGSLTNTSDKDFSGNVYFNVPKNIDVKMACELVNGTEHSCQPYELDNKGDYQVLHWKTTHPIAPGQDYPIWLEFYYNPLKGYPNKTMTLDYTPYYKTQNLKLTIKEPLKSSNFTIDPAPSSSNQDSEGFKNDFYTFQNLQPNQLMSLKISYTRSEKEPSVKPQNQNNNQQAAAASDPLGTSAWQKPEVIIPVILFIIVLIIFIFYSLKSSKNTPPTDRIKRIQNKYGNSNDAKADNPFNKSNGLAAEKKRIRQMLLDGEITEETYRELMNDL